MDTLNKTLDPKTLRALAEALDDEYKARATYRAVLDRFGDDVLPFANIVESEQRHIDALLGLYRHYQTVPPDDPWAGLVDAPATLADACARGVAAEIENETMYERLLEDVHEPDVRSVLQRLREASRDRHLPAFRRCVARGGAIGHGRRRRRRGRGA
jgi:rubrerythrin